MCSMSLPCPGLVLPWTLQLPLGRWGRDCGARGWMSHWEEQRVHFYGVWRFLIEFLGTSLKKEPPCCSL